jgi:hypothetical protein
VASIAAGANFTQITEPTTAKANITIIIEGPDKWNWHIIANMITGGSEPHVPGAIGRRPSPKHDASNLFIMTEG